MFEPQRAFDVTLLFSTKKESAYGTALADADLTRRVTVARVEAGKQTKLFLSAPHPPRPPPPLPPRRPARPQARPHHHRLRRADRRPEAPPGVARRQRLHAGGARPAPSRPARRLDAQAGRVPPV